MNRRRLKRVLPQHRRAQRTTCPIRHRRSSGALLALTRVVSRETQQRAVSGTTERATPAALSDASADLLGLGPHGWEGRQRLRTTARASTRTARHPNATTFMTVLSAGCALLLIVGAATGWPTAISICARKHRGCWLRPGGDCCPRVALALRAAAAARPVAVEGQRVPADAAHPGTPHRGSECI